jgi:hypothetical protein
MQLDNGVSLFLIGLFALGSLIAAYNLGWNAGHDVHHDEPDKPAAPPSTLWK